MVLIGDPADLARFRKEKLWLFEWLRALDPVILRVFFEYLHDMDLARFLGVYMSNVELRPKWTHQMMEALLCKRNFCSVAAVRWAEGKGVSPNILHLYGAHITSVEDLRYVLDHGVNVQDFTLTVPLTVGWAKTSFGQMCCDGESDIICAFLNRTQTDVEEVCCFYGMRAVHIAAYKGYKDIMCILVEDHKAVINTRNEGGGTPLMEAVFSGHIDIVKYLVEHGADINDRNNNGISVIYWARYHGHQDIVQYLENQGAII